MNILCQNNGDFMIQSYYGTGKGKTTAAVGAAVRAAGSGMKVFFSQFLKNGDSSELKALKNIENIDVILPNAEYVMFEELTDERIKMRSEAYSKLLFEELPQKIKHYDMIVLDEVLDILEFGYISEDEFLKSINLWKKEKELILTGHKISEKSAQISDYVSEVRAVKHPCEQGVSARPGIEY